MLIAVDLQDDLRAICVDISDTFLHWIRTGMMAVLQQELIESVTLRWPPSWGRVYGWAHRRERLGHFVSQWNQPGGLAPDEFVTDSEEPLEWSVHQLVLHAEYMYFVFRYGKRYDIPVVKLTSWAIRRSVLELPPCT